MKPAELRFSREYWEGYKAFLLGNYIMPGFTFYWQNQAFLLGWKEAQNDYH